MFWFDVSFETMFKKSHRVSRLVEAAAKWLQSGLLFFSWSDRLKTVEWSGVGARQQRRSKGSLMEYNTQHYRVETVITNNKLLCCCTLLRQMTLSERACLSLLQQEQTEIEANAPESICPGSTTIYRVTNYRTARTARGFLLSPVETSLRFFKGGRHLHENKQKQLADESRAAHRETFT